MMGEQRLKNKLKVIVIHEQFVPTQARSGDPGQGGTVSVGPIWNACIAIRPAKHRSMNSQNQNNGEHVTYSDLYGMLVNKEVAHPNDGCIGKHSFHAN